MLAADEPGTSFTFEPVVSVGPNDDRGIDLYSQIDRPLDRFKNLQIQQTQLTFRQALATPIPLRGRLIVNALDLDRWTEDGSQLRLGGTAEATLLNTPHWNLFLRAGPYVQFNRYRQRTDGTDLPRYGFTERAGVGFRYGPVAGEMQLLVEQYYGAKWSNDYSTFERIGYSLHANLVAGLQHELVSGLVDDSTGLYRGIRITDGRESRISVFVDWRI